MNRWRQRGKGRSERHFVIEVYLKNGGKRGFRLGNTMSVHMAGSLGHRIDGLK